MSLPIKIKDEPLDPGYGDEIPKPFVIKSEAADDDNIDEDISNLLDMVPLFDDEINERNEASIRVKSEPVDSPPSASVSVIKKEPEDLPDDFFDCLDDQNFLEAIADEDDDNDDNDAPNKTDGNEMKVNTSEVETELDDKTSKRSDDEDDEGNNDKNELSKEAVLTKEIEKLKRKIQKRTHKLGLKTETLLSKESLKANDECSQSSSSSSQKLEKTEKQDDKYRRGRDYDRSRSGSRSPSSRKGRHRKRIRSRSRSRSRTRSRSRSRSPSYSRSRKNRRSRSRSPNNNYHQKLKRPSFLEEIAETFARKGIPFPEKEKLEKMNKNVGQDQGIASELNALKSSSSELNAIKSLSPSSSNTHHKAINSYNENKQMNDDGDEEEEFPLPIIIKTEPVDNDDNDTTNIYTNNDKENNQEQTEKENIPAPMIIKPEPVDYDEDYNSENATEEETPFARRLRVLNSCSEAIKNLHNRDVKKSNYKFLRTPIVFKSPNDDEHFNENRSVLNCTKNVMFPFNSTTSNINLKMYGLEKLSENASKVAEIIGFDVKSIKERLNQKDLPYSLKVLRKKSKTDESNNEQNDEDKKTNRYRPFYSNMATQTEPYSCSACIIRQLRKYKDTGVQVQPIAENQCSSQAHSQTGSPVQQQQQQQQPYYMAGVNHQQQQQMSPVQSAPMMYNNYVQPMANSYPSYPYQQMAGYGPQPMMNMNGNMMPMQNMPVYPQQQQQQQQQQQPAMGMIPQPVPPPSQHQQHYPSNIRSHPGPRTLPSSSNTRRNNYTIPTISPTSKR